MKSISTLFRQLSLIVVLISAFSLSAWGEETLETTFSSDDVVGNSSYQAYSNNYWDLTFGGNNKSGGTNSKNALNCKLTEKYGTQVNISNLAFAITSKQVLNNISKITFTYTGGSNYANGLIYLAYSTDGTNYTAVTLTGATKQGSSIGTLNTIYNLEFSSIPSAYYKIIIGSTATSGNFRFDDITANFYSVSSSGGETPEPTQQLATPTGLNATNITSSSFTANWTAVDNATSYIVTAKSTSVTANSTSQTVITTSCTFDGLNPETEYTYTVVAKGDGANYSDSEAASATVETTALPKYNVTLYNGDTQYGEVLNGSTVNLPTTGPTPSQACQNAGWEFAGWSTSPITEDATSATLLTGTYTPKANITLYAVYKLGEDEDPISITAKNITDGWNVNETNKNTKYWGLFKDNYITTPEISLDNIKSIVVFMGTYGGDKGKTLQIINNSTSGVIATKDATSNSEDTKYTIDSFNGKNGNAKLKFQSNTTSETVGLRIKSITINFNGAIYNSAPICAEKETLATPTLTSSNVDKRGFVISWESIENADQYDVTISNSAEEIVKETITETSYTATDLTPGTEYVCKVKAINSAGDFYDSEEVSLTITTATPSTYTITWNTNGTEKTTEYTEGQALELPTPTIESTDYCNFAGWYTESTLGSNLNPSQAPIGEKVTSATKPIGNVTYYAVYDNSKLEEKVTSNLTDGTYYIRTEDGIYYTGKVSEKTYGGYSSNVADAAEITISTDGANFAIFDGSYWLSSPSNNNLTFNNNKVSDWTLTIDGKINSISQTDRYLQYNTASPRFACYTGTQKDAFLYKKGTEATAYFSTIEEEFIINNNITTIKHNTHVNSLTLHVDKTPNTQLEVTETITADKVTVIQTIDASRWFFFSLPFDCNIADIVATGANGTLTYAPNETDGDYVITEYNGGWVELIGTSHTLKANQGYIIGHFGSGDVTVKFPSNGAQNISAPANATLEKTSDNGFNLIGLPYFQKVNVSLNNVNHLSIPNEDGETYNQTDDLSLLANIAPFTSFFVQTEDENIEFTLGAQQNAAPRLDGRSNQASLHKAVVTLTDANGGTDKTTIINNPSKTTDYEIGHDLTKLIGYAEIPQIYSLQGDEMLAFNSLAIDNSTVIPLGIYAHADGDYTFSLSEKSVGDLEGWELYDNETGKTTRLANEDLTVNLAQGTHEGRFEIRLQQRISTDCDNAMGDMTTWTANGTFNINNLPADAVVYIYDAVGRMVYVANNNSTTFNYTFAARGVYNIVVRTAENSVSFKTIY